MPAIRLTDKLCANAKLPDGKSQLDVFDDVVPGLALRIGAKVRSFTVHVRGKRTTLGQYPALSLAEARSAALEVRNGAQDAPKSKATTLRDVAELYLNGDGAKLRTVDERRAVLQRHILPALGDRPIGEIKRSEVVAVLDRLAGDRIHDLALSYLQRVFNWHAIRDESFRTPLMRGMARGSAPRNRVLSDDELRRVWKACADIGWYGQYVRLLCLTACRRADIEDMKRTELSADGSELLIPASRYKTNVPHLVPLSAPAQAIVRTLLEAVPPTVDRLFLNGTIKFGRLPHDKLKAASGVNGFTLHDLRRTARTLMARIGIPNDHAERCLGHVIGGIRGVYDHHDYREEKRAAFEKLAREIARIVE